MSRDSDLGWAAGIVDGEGCIILKLHNRARGCAYVLKVSVSNTSLPMLKRIKDILGAGAIRLQRPGSTKSNGSRHRTTWQWEVVASQAEMALRLIWPYLVNKREEADVALESRKLIGPRYGGRVKNVHGEVFADMSQRLTDLKKVEFLQ